MNRHPIKQSIGHDRETNNIMKRSHRPRLAALMVGAGLLAACTSGGEETTPTTPATDGDGSTASTLDGDFGGETAEILFESPNSDDFNKLLTSQDDLIALREPSNMCLGRGRIGPVLEEVLELVSGNPLGGISVSNHGASGCKLASLDYAWVQ